MNKLKWLVLGVLATGMLSIAACGDDDDDDADTEETEEAAEETEEAAEGGAAEVTGVEFEFQFEAGSITTSTTGLNFVNGGEQVHELVFFNAEEDLDLEAALASEDEEAVGFTEIGGTGAEPGGTGEIVFEEPLVPGRYVMLCFVPDEADGEPHFTKGMVADFTIE